MSPQIIRQVTKELMDLQKNPPEGIKVIMNEEDVTDIQATIEGPDGTPYAGGHFYVKVLLGKSFPAEAPKGFFLTKIFHPNVAKNGEICVNTLKKDWKCDYGVKHILLTIKCLLIVPNPESALNEEAGKLLLEHYDEYCTRARLFTEIHARPTPKCMDNSASSTCSERTADGPSVKKHAADMMAVALERKKKLDKDKKKSLKRL